MGHYSRHISQKQHISQKHTFVKELLNDRVIVVNYVKSSQNFTDPFIKDLERDKISKKMGLKSIKTFIFSGNPTLVLKHRLDSWDKHVNRVNEVITLEIKYISPPRKDARSY